jgi:hypothetical protein
MRHTSTARIAKMDLIRRLYVEKIQRVKIRIIRRRCVAELKIKIGEFKLTVD